MTTPFYKMQGAGNDFVFFMDKKASPEMVAKICDRRFGIGADGAVWMYKEGEKKFRWEFFNSDGSRAEMCGNAARCAALLCKILFGVQEMELATAAGVIYCHMKNNEIEIESTISNSAPKEIHSPAGTDFAIGHLINTGVPHCVIQHGSPMSLQERGKKLAKYIFNPDFGSGGANLTFANLNTNPIETITFERGVNDFTLACGTGVMATAKLAMWLNPSKHMVSLKTPGGEFTVRIEGNKIFLLGPAQLVYKGEI